MLKSVHPTSLAGSSKLKSYRHTMAVRGKRCMLAMKAHKLRTAVLLGLMLTVMLCLASPSLLWSSAVMSREGDDQDDKAMRVELLGEFEAQASMVDDAKLTAPTIIAPGATQPVAGRDPFGRERVLRRPLPGSASSGGDKASIAQIARLQQQNTLLREKNAEVEKHAAALQLELESIQRVTAKNNFGMAAGPRKDMEIVPFKRPVPASNPWVNPNGKLPRHYRKREYFPMNTERQALLDEWRSKRDREALRYWDTDVGPSMPVKRRPARLADERFLTLEWYNGGFNNIRHSIEQMLLLAAETGRTIVLPPPSIDSHRNMQFVVDMFSYYDTHAFNTLVPTITHTEFLALIESGAFTRDYPATQARPVNAASMTSVRFHDVWNQHPIAEIARIVPGPFWGHLLCLAPDACVDAVAAAADTGTAAAAQQYFEWYRQGEGTLSQRDARSLFAASATKPSPSRILHFPQTLFGVFHRLFYLPPGPARARMTTSVRDRVRYHPATFAYASRMVAALGGASKYGCLHVRRGDWILDKKKVVDMTTLANNVRGILNGVTVLYIATNEVDHSKVAPLADLLGVTLRFLDMDVISTDLQGRRSALSSPPSLMIPNIDQLVCSRASVFSGTWLSTYTGYIQRLRGYYRDTPDRNIYYNERMNTAGVSHFIRGTGSVTQDFDGDGGGPSWHVPAGVTNPPVWSQDGYPESYADLQTPLQQW